MIMHHIKANHFRINVDIGPTYFFKQIEHSLISNKIKHPRKQIIHFVFTSSIHQYVPDFPLSGTHNHYSILNIPAKAYPALSVPSPLNSTSAWGGEVFPDAFWLINLTQFQG